MDPKLRIYGYWGVFVWGCTQIPDASPKSEQEPAQADLANPQNTSRKTSSPDLECRGNPSYTASRTMWLVVKIMVPFWVPIITRHLLFRVAQKGTLILTTAHVTMYTPEKSKVSRARLDLPKPEMGLGFRGLGFRNNSYMKLHKSHQKPFPNPLNPKL